MGKKLVLHGVTLTDLSAPKLATVDQVESAGSMLLLEPGHPLCGPFPAPSNGLVIPNLFASQFQAVSGTADPGNAISLQGTGLDGIIRMAWTPKRGLEGLVTATQVNGKGAAVIPSTAWRSWLFTTKAAAHQLYISTWLRPTRHGLWSNFTRFAANGSDPLSLTTYQYAGTGTPTSRWRITANPSQIGTNVAPVPVVGQPLRASANVIPANATGWVAPLVLAGPVWQTPTGVYYSAGASASYVFYRLYVEDLTVSGRSYADVDAIDSALHASAFGPGGRYYGDTWTDPALLP